MRFPAAVVCACLAACAPERTPEDAIRTGISYTELDWLPEERHIRHGKDSRGIMVHTPDRSLGEFTGDSRGWWRPGVPATGMAYKWGGFDTPESFLQGLAQGKKAGDVASAYKVRGDNAVVSHESVGIDCSGFVSRCWGLPEHVSTRDLPAISEPVPWDGLRMGDIILKEGHVILFAERKGSYIVGLEAGPIPTWRARQCAILISYLKKEGYSPWRYRNMAEPIPAGVESRFAENHAPGRWQEFPR